MREQGGAWCGIANGGPEEGESKGMGPTSTAGAQGEGRQREGAKEGHRRAEVYGGSGNGAGLWRLQKQPQGLPWWSSG